MLKFVKLISCLCKVQAIFQKNVVLIFIFALNFFRYNFEVLLSKIGALIGLSGINSLVILVRQIIISPSSRLNRGGLLRLRISYALVLLSILVNLRISNALILLGILVNLTKIVQIRP